ncbi:MAG TPA: hypothetical protein VGB17_13945 [Pyrinomonadaceae bacterium]
MSSQLNPRQLGELLHQRLLSDASLTVTNEIAEKFLVPVAKSLARKFPNITDQHLIDSAAEEALLSYLDRPLQFDPLRASLFTFLCLRAKTYLLNSLGHQKNSQGSGKVVELDDPETVYELEAQDESVETILLEQESETEIMRELKRIIADPKDLQVVILMMEGVRETKAFADVLGISDKSAEEQAKLVKQAKDRLKKTLQRKLRLKGRQS